MFLGKNPQEAGNKLWIRCGKPMISKKAEVMTGFHKGNLCGSFILNIGDMGSMNPQYVVSRPTRQCAKL